MVFGHDKNEGEDIISNNSDYYIQNIIPKSYSTLALGSNNWEWSSITKKLRNIWIRMKDIKSGDPYDFSNYGYHQILFLVVREEPGGGI